MIIENVSLFTIVGLFITSIIAGTIDAIAGGGGLITLPALMAVGLDPVSVLATNKVQGIFSSLSATIHFWRQGMITLKDHWKSCILSCFGAILGALTVTHINPDFLRNFVPFILIIIALWMMFRKNLGQQTHQQKISLLLCSLTFIPTVGFYDGFFGPGTGAFFAVGLVSLLGISLQEATLRAKLYNLSSNFGALAFFLISGHIMWFFGIIMMVGMAIGGNLGARLILRHGTSLIKPILVIMSLLMSLRLLWQQGFIQKIFY